jgi:hypothetical protein
MKMELELDYVEYGLELVLTIVAMTLLLLVDFENPVSLIYMMGLPVLFGYTAFISENTFNKSTLISIIGLIYIPISSFMAVMAFLVFLLNVQISVFTSENSVRAYYSSTAMPLIVTGLILGLSVMGYSMVNSEFESNLENTVVNIGGNKSMQMIESSGLTPEAQRERAKTLANQTVTATEGYVIRDYSQNAEDPEPNVLRDSFQGAREEVLASMDSGASGEMSIESNIRSMIQSMVEGKLAILAVPLSVILFYTFQPFIGLLTAIYAVLFRTAENHI